MNCRECGRNAGWTLNGLIPVTIEVDEDNNVSSVTVIDEAEFVFNAHDSSVCAGCGMTHGSQGAKEVQDHINPDSWVAWQFGF